MDDIIIDNQPVSVMVDRRGKINLKVNSFGNYLYNLFIKALLLAVLFSLNFCLFVRAGSYDVFGAGDFYPVLGGIIVKIFLCALVLMFVLSFSRLLQNALLALSVGIFVMAMLNQFALFDRYTFLSETVKVYLNDQLGEFLYGISDLAAAALAALLVFAYLGYASKSNLAYLFGTLLILNAYILFGAHMNNKYPSGWSVDYDNYAAGNAKGKKIVNIMLANAASYSYVDHLNQSKHEEKDVDTNSQLANLQKIMLAFAVNNGFQLYPNAYVSRSDHAENISSILNFGQYETSQLSLYPYSQNSWDFNRLSSHRYQLNENKFQSLFADAHYKLSVYQSQDVDLCRQYGKMSVDRCVTKLNMPSNVDILVKSPEDKQSILLAQWLESMGLIDEFGKFYHNVLGAVLDTSGLSDDGYQKLYVLNSLKALQYAADAIVHDKGNGLYTLVIDMPADMFIYNEFCMLKPKKQWLSMDVPSWEKNTSDNQQQRIDAYAEQYSCLFGQLQSFIDTLKANNSYQNTVIVLQGFSAPEDGNNMAKKDARTRFGSQQNVFFAIYDPLKTAQQPDMRLCHVGELLYSYLYNKKDCTKLSGLPLVTEDVNKLEKLEHNYNISADYVKNAQNFYKHWYKYWEKASSIDVGTPKIQKKTASSSKSVKPLAKLPNIETTKKISEKKVVQDVVDEGKEAPVKSLVQTQQEFDKQKKVSVDNVSVETIKNDALSQKK